MAQSHKKQSVSIKAGIPTLIEGKWTIEWESEGDAENVSKSIAVKSPANGEKIRPKAGEPSVLTRAIRGTISGFKKDEIEKRRFSVSISIYTDKWYPQGVAKVENDATWVLEHARFGGTVHTIRAILKDKDNRELATTDIVTDVLR